MAKAIVAVRASSGIITPKVLATISRRVFSSNELDEIDFTQNISLIHSGGDTSDSLEEESKQVRLHFQWKAALAAAKKILELNTSLDF